MKLLRLVTVRAEAEKFRQVLEGKTLSSSASKGLEPEIVALPIIQQICVENDVELKIVTIGEFLQTPYPESECISLLFNTPIEPFLYGPFWPEPLRVDGINAYKNIQDKFHVYKLVAQFSEILQPKTVVLRGNTHLDEALKEITTSKVVIKPRFNDNSSESRNVFIMERHRLENRTEGEIFNFMDSIMQEYLPQTSWPPCEWRLHFVGRELCRCQKIMDKNNWKKSFTRENILPVNVPQALSDSAAKIASVLVDKENKDNFILDFLEAGNDYLFLEANCGYLNSFLVPTLDQKQFIEPVYKTLFRKYFHQETASS